MLKKIGLVVVIALCSLNLTGCLALFAGAAAGGGTAKWMSDKLVQDVSAPYDRAVEAAHSGLTALDLHLTKENASPKVTQLRGEYPDGKNIYVDVHRTSDTTSRIEVRVGMMNGKEDASKILNSILQYLPSGSHT